MNRNFTARAIGTAVLQAPAPTEKTQMPEPAFTEQDWRRFLAGLGEDPTRTGLVEAPSRVAKAWKHWTSGYAQDPAECLKVFEDGAREYSELIGVRGIPVYSHCEHHLAPFLGQATIGYVPDGKIVGLAKLTRLVDCFSKRLQLQERLTTKRDEIDPAERLPKPNWIRVKAASPSGRFRKIKDIVRINKLVTVCEEASCPNTYIEILTPDFGGHLDHALEILSTAPLDVLNHKIETVPRLYKEARPGADIKNSLNLLHRCKAMHATIPTRSGLMAGLGETDAEEAYKMGFRHAASGLLVCSSYHAGEQAHAAGVF